MVTMALATCRANERTSIALMCQHSLWPDSSSTKQYVMLSRSAALCDSRSTRHFLCNTAHHHTAHLSDTIPLQHSYDCVETMCKCLRNSADIYSIIIKIKRTEKYLNNWMMSTIIFIETQLIRLIVCNKLIDIIIIIIIIIQRSTMFLRQRLSVAVQRGNAGCIIGTLRPVVGGSY